MKRIFISTSHDLHGLFNDEEYTVLKSRLDNSDLSLLVDNNVLYYNDDTKKFDSTTTNSNIIIIKDSYTKDKTDVLDTIFENIDKDNDGWLHHNRENSHNEAVEAKFKYIKKGEHTTGNENGYLYEKVFKIIFDNDNNKTQRIIEFLFGETVTYTSEDGTEKTANKIDVQDAYRKLLHSFTLAYIKDKNGSNSTIEIADCKTSLKPISAYLEDIRFNGEINLTSIHQFIQENQTKIEKELFN